jgi:V8-like Glu-specific endopeptidase
MCGSFGRAQKGKKQQPTVHEAVPSPGQAGTELFPAEPTGFLKILKEAPGDPYTRIIETICGVKDDSQPVEQYDGKLGVDKNFVDSHQTYMGQLQWNDNLDRIYSKPGNVSGQRWCSGALIADDLFLTAGHCFDRDAGGWQLPRIEDTDEVIDPQEIAQNMHVNFNYQVDADGNLQDGEPFSIAELVVYRPGEDELDVAVIRLDGSPGRDFGKGVIAAEDAGEGDMLCIIGHPEGMPKRIEAGQLLEIEGNEIRYDSIDTRGGNSGSAILRSPDGTIVGVHTNGGCTSGGGFNYGQTISSFQNSVSTTEDVMSDQQLEELVYKQVADSAEDLIKGLIESLKGYSPGASRRIDDEREVETIGKQDPTESITEASGIDDEREVETLDESQVLTDSTVVESAASQVKLQSKKYSHQGDKWWDPFSSRKGTDRFKFTIPSGWQFSHYELNVLHQSFPSDIRVVGAPRAGAKGDQEIEIAWSLQGGGKVDYAITAGYHEQGAATPSLRVLVFSPGWERKAFQLVDQKKSFELVMSGQGVAEAWQAITNAAGLPESPVREHAGREVLELTGVEELILAGILAAAGLGFAGGAFFVIHSILSQSIEAGCNTKTDFEKGAQPTEGKLVFDVRCKE